MKRYTATYTIYMDAYNDKHARSKAKLIAERERANYPNQNCWLEQLDETPFASFNTRSVPLQEPITIPGFEGTMEELNNIKIR